MDRRWLAVCACLAMTVPAWAADPSYLSEWPTVERVLADHRGDNPRDTMARQMAALHILQASIEEMAGPRRWHGLTSDEEALRGQYHRGAESIRDVVNSTLSNDLGPGFHGPFAKPPLREWYALQWEYESDPAFRASTLQKYLSPPLLATLGAQASAAEPGAQRTGERRKLLPMLLAGLAAWILLVFAVRGWRRRRVRKGQLPPDDRAQATNPAELADLDAAAKEVVDSIEPYIRAAQKRGQRLPARVLADPYIFNFILCYCRAAMAAVKGTTTQAEFEAGMLVLQRIFRTQWHRIEDVFDDNVPDASEIEGIKENRGPKLAGVFAAKAVLMIFADDKANPQDHGGEEAGDLAGVVPPVDPPVTRLHPDGPRAEAARWLMLTTFSQPLAELAAGIT